MERTERIAVRFYANANGREPVREFLVGLPDSEKKIIGSDLKVVQWRWPTHKPLVDHLGDSIYELRSTLPTRIIRVLFSQVDDTLVLLHIFIKKTQKTPSTEKSLALKRLKEIKRHET